MSRTAYTSRHDRGRSQRLMIPPPTASLSFLGHAALLPRASQGVHVQAAELAGIALIWADVVRRIAQMWSRFFRLHSAHRS